MACLGSPCCSVHSLHSLTSQQSLHSFHSLHAAGHNAAQINQALEAARVDDRIMATLRYNALPTGAEEGAASVAAGGQAGGGTLFKALPASLAPSAVLKKFAATSCELPGQRRHGTSASARSSGSPAAESPPGSWQPGILRLGSAVASVAFTKWQHMQHRYDTCTNTMSNGLSTDAPAESALGKRARSEESIETGTSSRAASPALSDESGTAHVSKMAQASEPVPSPMHSVSKASIEALLVDTSSTTK